MYSIKKQQQKQCENGLATNSEQSLHITHNRRASHGL